MAINVQFRLMDTYSSSKCLYRAVLQYCDDTANIGSKMLVRWSRQTISCFKCYKLPRVHLFVDNLVGYTNNSEFRIFKKKSVFICWHFCCRYQLTYWKLIFGWTYYKLTVVPTTFCGVQQHFDFWEEKKKA